VAKIKKNVKNVFYIYAVVNVNVVNCDDRRNSRLA